MQDYRMWRTLMLPSPLSSRAQRGIQAPPLDPSPEPVEGALAMTDGPYAITLYRNAVATPSIRYASFCRCVATGRTAVYRLPHALVVVYEMTCASRIAQIGCDLICGAALIDPETLSDLIVLGSVVVAIALICARYLGIEPPPPPPCRAAYWRCHLVLRRPDLTIEECSRMGRILAAHEIACGTETIAGRLTALMEQYPPATSAASCSR